MSNTAYLPVADRNLILTGYIGPNQPAIGRQVSIYLGVPFFNVEMIIEEREGMSIKELRGQYGESHLKTVENEILQEALLHRNAVIRVNGRILQNKANFERLQSTGPVICLIASLDSILQRLHLSLGARYHSPHDRGMALGHLRQEWAVRKLPGIIEVDTTYLSEAETIQTVAERWKQTVMA